MFFSPTEESHTGEAIQCGPSGSRQRCGGADPTWPTSKPLTDTNWSGRVQVNVAVWGMRASTVFIHGREELENVAECQLVTPEQLQKVAA